MPTAIKLIVGLGNPGAEYATTRHNVGAWFVEYCVNALNLSLKKETKFFGLVSQANLKSLPLHLFIPSTYMNESGKAVSLIARFYKIMPQEILVAHDELDYPAGKIRFKQSGGHGGHNGLRDIIRCLGVDQFFRLRIGIGHPGHKDRVSPYVLSRPSDGDATLINQAIESGFAVLPDLCSGNIEKAIQSIHSN